MTLIDDLLASARAVEPHPHNDHFGLAGAIDTEDRTQLLNEKLAMAAASGSAPVALAARQKHRWQPSLPSRRSGRSRTTATNGLNGPKGSVWFRTAHSRTADRGGDGNTGAEPSKVVVGP